MRTNIPHYWGKMAEKNEVKHGYPHKNNGIIWDHFIDSFSAHNSINIYFDRQYHSDIGYGTSCHLPHHTIGLLRCRHAISCPVGIMVTGWIYRVTLDNALIWGGPLFLQWFFFKWVDFVLIGKKISWIFQNSPYFYMLPTSDALYSLLNANPSTMQI